MNRLNQSLQALLLFAVCSAGVAVAGDSAAPPPASGTPASGDRSGSPSKPKPKYEFERLAEQLAGSDKVAQDAAVERIRTILTEHRSVADGRVTASKINFNSLWLPALMKKKRFADVEAIAVLGILQAPSRSKQSAMLQKARADAFLASGKYNEALSAAKAYYNVCNMADSAAAVELIGVCLSNARPKDRGIANRFKAQQVSLATTQPASTQPHAADPNILESIEVDAQPFKETLEEITFRDFESLVARGNLLLLSNRAAEARACFESAGEFAQDDKQLATMIEGVARSIRAETGAIGPANSYIISQQGR